MTCFVDRIWIQFGSAYFHGTDNFINKYNIKIYLPHYKHICIFAIIIFKFVFSTRKFVRNYVPSVRKRKFKNKLEERNVKQYTYVHIIILFYIQQFFS